MEQDSCRALRRHVLRWREELLLDYIAVVAVEEELVTFLWFS
jgi:hypothetical protein